MNTKLQRSDPGRSIWSPLALVAAILVGSVLIFSAYTKILSPKAFVASVESYGLLPTSLVLPGATGLIGLEIALGLMLVLGPGRRIAAFITLPLVLLFIGMVTYAMQVGLEECGCFGEVIKMEPRQELFVDIVLLALTGLVIWKGRGVEIGSPHVAPTLGWGGLALGAALFLAAGPALSEVEGLDLSMEDLAVLAQADPPLEIGEDAFLFFFAADCDHCWAFAGGVQLMHDRVEGLPVHAVTYSDRLSLDSFREAFAPTYPIHVLDRRAFDALVANYPAGIWIQAGGISQTWAGFVPSHRQIVEGGGYSYRQPGEFRGGVGSPLLEQEVPAPGLPDFGGTMSGRRSQ